MTVGFRKDRGMYYVDAVWPDKIRTRKFVPDKETADRIWKKVEVATADEERIWKKLRKDLGLEQGGNLQGLSQLADLYYDLYVLVYNRNPLSKKSRINILKRHFRSVSSIINMNNQLLDQFISKRRKEDGVGNRTINRDLIVLHHMYLWAVKRGYLESIPFQFERLEEIEFVGERPDEEVIDKIFANIDPRRIPVYTFLRETGCRRGEAITLKLSQIDFARLTVTFHTNTKNGRSRQVPLTEDAIWAVQAMPKHGSTVFYNPDLMQPWTGDSVDYRWEKAREAVGSNLRLHDLRHAYGISLAEAGTPMHFISEVMGHHSVDFTRRIYAKFSPESASKAVLRVLQGKKDRKMALGSVTAPGRHREVFRD